MTIVLFLLLVAFILALLAAIGVTSPVGLFPMAFAFFVLAQIVSSWHH